MIKMLIRLKSSRCFSLIIVYILAAYLSSCNEQKYDSIKIGQQVWMLKNLEVSTFRNGDSIPQVFSASEWAEANTNREPAWCYYLNNNEYGIKQGKLYNWYAVNDPRGLAPIGWRIPSASDWEMLSTFLGGDLYAGTKLKSKTGWHINGTNESGFTAVPAAIRLNTGDFGFCCSSTAFWSSTPSEDNNVWYYYLDDDYTKLGRNDHWRKGSGLSVRCIKE
jgi:uncharacterized protein (TIGR02145 family)